MCCVKMTEESGNGSNAKAFETVRRQIGFCGLGCGSCAVGNGTINEHAKNLGRLSKDYAIEEWGPKDIDYNELKKSLKSIHSMSPCSGCLKGGGRMDCEIRSCAISRGLRECSECDDIDDCENSKLLRYMRSGARRVGMKVKKEKERRSEFLKRVEMEIRDKR